MYLNYRYIFIIITHRDQKTFNVFIIKCINFIIYIQRQINKILRRLRRVKTYINNIIIDIVILLKHLDDFQKLFQLFIKYNIIISSIKTYFEYLNVNLFNRKINFFDLISLKKN